MGQVEFSVRAMTAEDWTQVVTIYAQGIAGHKATFAQEAPSYQEWNEEYHEHTRLVAQTLDGKVIGWAAIQPSFARKVYCGVAEVSVYIDDAFQHCGVGTALLKKLAEESEANGIWTLEALIFDDNTASLQLFKKCGYALLGIRQKLGYDEALKRWRNVAVLERRSTKKDFT